jgi:hypothetical protein
MSVGKGSTVAMMVSSPGCARQEVQDLKCKA